MGPSETAGYVVGILLFPVLGVILLVAGLRRRSSARRTWSPPPPPPPTAPGEVPPPPPPPGYAVAAPKKSSGTVLVVVGAVLLVLGLLGLVGQLALKGAEVASRKVGAGIPEVGDCITEASYQTRRVNPGTVDCGTRSARYELAYRGDGSAKCPDGKVTDSLYSVLRSTTTTLCYEALLVEKACYQLEQKRNAFVPVGCQDPKAQVRVVARLDGVDDTKKCPAGSQGVSYPKPARTYCLTPAGG